MAFVSKMNIEFCESVVVQGSKCKGGCGRSHTKESVRPRLCDSVLPCVYRYREFPFMCRYIHEGEDIDTYCKRVGFDPDHKMFDNKKLSVLRLVKERLRNALDELEKNRYIDPYVLRRHILNRLNFIMRGPRRDMVRRMVAAGKRVRSEDVMDSLNDEEDYEDGLMMVLVGYDEDPIESELAYESDFVCGMIEKWDREEGRTVVPVIEPEQQKTQVNEMKEGRTVVPVFEPEPEQQKTQVNEMKDAWDYNECTNALDIW